MTNGFFLPRELYMPLPTSKPKFTQSRPHRPQLQIVDTPKVIVQPWQEQPKNFANAQIVNGKLLTYVKKLVSKMSPKSRTWLNWKMDSSKSPNFPFARIE